MLVRNSLLLMILVAVTACGWHLRGTGPDSLAARIQNIAVRASSVPEVGNQVRQILRRSGVNLVADANAQAILSLSGERYDTRVLSVNPDTGKATEYEVGYQIMISVTGADGALLLEPEALELTRDYTFDETAVLGKYAEEYLLRNEIRIDAAESIVRRLDSIEL
jgi:LPS-assembly lipoprotein